VTAPRKKPAEPATPWPAAGPHISRQPSREDLLELSEPSDYPKYPDRWTPEYPDLAELLELRRTRDPEPDLEAEP
jgi:hypothetical protein